MNSCIYTTVVNLCQIIPEKLEKGQVLSNPNKKRGDVVELRSSRNVFNCTANIRVLQNPVGK